ncbi:hypothetical protein V8C86DRAFT_2748390 [Haematococcus lacustris]
MAHMGQGGLLAPSGPDSPPLPVAAGAPALVQSGLQAWLRVSLPQALTWPSTVSLPHFWLPDLSVTLPNLQELNLVPSPSRTRIASLHSQQAPQLAGLPPGQLPDPCPLSRVWLDAAAWPPCLTSLSLQHSSLGRLEAPLTSGLTQLQRLELQGCELVAVAAQVSQLQGLTQLSLRGNQLTGLPQEVAALSLLRNLDLGCNMLADLPPALPRALTCLLLDHNQLKQLPQAVMSLVSLQHLSLSSNWLEGLGHSFALLCDLTHLTRLDLANVSTRKQPLVISTMVLQLQQLRELDVSNNAACEVCCDLSQLPALKALNQQ